MKYNNHHQKGSGFSVAETMSSSGLGPGPAFHHSQPRRANEEAGVSPVWAQVGSKAQGPADVSPVQILQVEGEASC